MNLRMNWSFDYEGQHRAPVSFSQLMDQRIDPHPQPGPAAQYCILPNYAFNHPASDIRSSAEIVIGEMRMTRRRDESGIWKYEVRQENRNSGEKLSLTYDCADHPLRHLINDWSVEAANCAGDRYERRSFSGSVPACAQPAICNYTLFDLIPQWASQGQRVPAFAVLEQLQRLRQDVRFGYLQSDRLNVAGSAVPIRGYYLYGKGMPPSYWWINEEGFVLIMTSTLMTYVRTQTL